MVNEIHQAYINALLADAAYIDGNLKGKTYTTALTNRMNKPQADFIEANFERVTYFESDENGSSFDAVVFRGKAGTEYAGQYYLAIRGTQETKDITGADVGLAVGEAANAQIVDMINWWLRIITPAGQSCEQISLSLRSGKLDYEILKGTGNGTGELSGLTHIQLAAHSLGGHLASAFARIFGGTISIDGVTTFNSAGFISSSKNFFERVFSALGLKDNGFYPSQNNYFAENGINVTTNDWWLHQVGERKPIFNEQSTLTYKNHFMYKLTDTLALGDALSKLDPTLSIANLNNLLELAGNHVDASLENMLDAVRKIILGANDLTITGDEGDNSASRASFHNHLSALQSSAAFKQLIGNARIMQFDESYTHDATAGLAARYALQELNSFILVGADYSRYNQDGALDLYDPATGEGQITDHWLTDRQKLLNIKIQLDQYNVGSQGVADYTMMNTIEEGINGIPAYNPYKDIRIDGFSPAGHSLKIMDVNSGISIENKTDSDIEDTIQFGGKNKDTLTGQNNEDHLYGGAGDDTLMGGDALAIQAA